jgi:hypothetical protein
MLLDNKTKSDDNEYYKVYDFIKNYAENGNLDIVSGFFTVHALALFKDEVNSPEKFRLILGNLLKESLHQNKIVDLLN